MIVIYINKIPITDLLIKALKVEMCCWITGTSFQSLRFLRHTLLEDLKGCA